MNLFVVLLDVHFFLQMRSEVKQKNQEKNNHGGIRKHMYNTRSPLLHAEFGPVEREYLYLRFSFGSVFGKRTKTYSTLNVQV